MNSKILVSRWDRFRWSVLALSILVMVGGCTIHLAPDYSRDTAEAIVATEKQVDQFYANLEAAPEDQRPFKNYAEAYRDIEVEIRSLILRCKIQPMNDKSTDMANNLLDLWQKYEVRHQQRDTYTNILASDEQKRIDDLLTDMAMVNEALKDKTTTP